MPFEAVSICGFEHALVRARWVGERGWVGSGLDTVKLREEELTMSLMVWLVHVAICWLKPKLILV